MSLEAANPRINATVTASAGSGKTYMLVTRILRLLLEGVEPGSILAMTFTRKAAAEMQQRLTERLYQLAIAEEDELDTLLAQLDPDQTGWSQEYKSRARQLYESHQYCDYPVRTTTFHSFCQDLLSRFPLEADIPPGFDLLESADLLTQQARDALYNEATLNMQGELAQHLQALMQEAGGLYNLDRILDNFLQHRSDWWAYTDQQSDPIEYAQQKLAEVLELDPHSDPLSHFFNDFTVQQLKQFSRLLVKAEGKKNLAHADTLTTWLVDKPQDTAAFEHISACFLKKDGEPLSSGRTENKSLSKRLGEDADTFYELHVIISAKILDCIEALNKQHVWSLNYHWFYCGEKYVHHYQILKRQQRLLDFTDLEWRSYKLLQDSDNALWVQYKLDQQIQHLLIDEFQDTNPTQWQLILPLLEEMAAAEHEQPRSVFLVGDEKQSIYSFRRAKPELQQQASNWLAQHLQAKAFPLNKSWRSSPAIIQTVNAIFSQDQFQHSLPGFETHQTHHETLYGRVEALPLCTSEQLEAPEEPVYCRNPLEQPRTETRGLHQLEAKQIAQHIQQLIDSRAPIIEGNAARAASYNDIFILVRKRSHVAEYEQALRQAGIPYLGTNRGTLLDCLEIQDMEALLDTLLTPFNDLALAQVLKSPLFNASDDDLQTIALCDAARHWFDRLTILSETVPPNNAIHRAALLITQWRELADKIPVHDLLDKIFDQGDVLARYQQATPDALQGRVQANLTLFLQMALDLDAGRYPSLMHFLDYLRSLRSTPSDAPDEAPMETREPRVRIMTIHASKGLEAPVVYLADTITTARDRSALSTLIDWPVDQIRPVHFQLLPAKSRQDKITAALNEKNSLIKIREDANLLYVAVTRARQYLFVSASRGDRGPFLNWYEPVQKAIASLCENHQQPLEESQPCYQFGSSPEITDETSITTPSAIEIPQVLTQKLSINPVQDYFIAPSRQVNTQHADRLHQSDTTEDQDAQLRGIAIHRMLELICSDSPHDDIIQRVATELNYNQPDELQNWFEIALSNYQHPELKTIFNPDRPIKVYNECPVHFKHNNTPAYGVIDRIIVEQHQVTLVDYKTHQHAQPDTLEPLCQAYLPQMQLYSEACQQLWPDKTVKAFLLFTECVSLVPVILT